MSRNNRDARGGHSKYWTTPSWFVRMFMNKPQRHEGRMWEREAAKTQVESLEDLDKPNVSKKPHKYFW